MDLADRTARGAELLGQMLGPEQADRVRQTWKEIWFFRF